MNQELVTHMLRLLVQNGPHGADRSTIQKWCGQYSTDNVTAALASLVRTGLVAKRRVRIADVGTEPLNTVRYVLRLDGVFPMLTLYTQMWVVSPSWTNRAGQCSECGGEYALGKLAVCESCMCFRCQNACMETHECGYLEGRERRLSTTIEQDGE